MQLRFNFGLLLILCCFQVAAKDSLDNLIKQQKNADESTLRAHKLEKKKDVYSNAQRNAFTLGDLPQEKNCFIINRIELEDNFLGGQLISEVQKAIAGRVSVVLVCKKLQLPCRIIILMRDISQRELVSLRRIFLKASYVSRLMPGR